MADQDTMAPENATESECDEVPVSPAPASKGKGRNPSIEASEVAEEVDATPPARKRWRRGKISPCSLDRVNPGPPTCCEAGYTATDWSCDDCGLPMCDDCVRESMEDCPGILCRTCREAEKTRREQMRRPAASSSGT